MTLRDYTANVISASKVVPDGNFKDSKASGVWDINEALDLIKGGNWPNAANFNPAAFVDGLFSIDLYEGNATARTITTNIDVSNNGGLVWIKARNSAEQEHNLYDTVRGAGERLISHATSTESTETQTLKSFTSSGFTLGTANMANQNGKDFVAWTWRKHPKFFDVVTYTGTGSAQAIAHNLGSVPGMIIIKSTDVAYNWGVFHRSLGNTKALILDATNASDTGSSYWNNTDPTSTHFTVGSDNTTNASDGGTYVAYLFAHNNSDGGFGEPEDQDIIKCDSYTGNGSSTGPVINLGFEPQFIMIKRASGGTGDWDVYDNMRGIPMGAGEERLEWNTSDAESTAGADRINLSSTGFSIATTNSNVNTNGDTYVYMAIRRSGMQTPTTASDVFAIDDQGESSAPYSISGFPVDMVLRKDIDGSRSEIMTRLTQGNMLVASATDAEASDSVAQFDFNNGCLGGTSQDTTRFSWMWKRARGYFDAVAYTGTGSAQNISHNLGVTPEMMWVKCRSNAENWVVYHSYANTKKWYLNLNAAQTNAGSQDFNDTPPTSSVFTVGDGNDTGASGRTYINFLFATAAGVSKVGSYTGNGNATGPTVDCGFSNGTKFVLLKRTTGLQNWYIYDTVRGLTSGDDKELEINSGSAERTGQVLNSTTSGFQLATSSSFANENGVNYIFYAIANDPS